MNNNNFFDNSSDNNQPNVIPNNNGIFNQPNNVPNTNGTINQTNNMSNMNPTAEQQNTIPNANMVTDQSNSMPNMNPPIGQQNTVSNTNPTISQQPVINMGETAINQNSTAPKKKNGLIVIIGIIIVVIVAIIFATKLFGGGSSNSSVGESLNSVSKTVDQGQELIINNMFNDVSVKVDSVERNVSVDSILGDENARYTKIGLTIKNNGDEKTEIILRNVFKLVDSNENEVSSLSCYTKTLGSAYNMTSAIEEEIAAKSTVSGYLYCRDDSNTGTKLKITSITSIDEEAAKQGRIISTGEDTFYINLR